MLSRARALCNRARELLEWAALEVLDVRLLRRPLAWSWRSLSTCNIMAAVALFVYCRARRTSSSIWLSLLVFSLSHFYFETRFVSAGSLAFCFVFASVLLSSLLLTLLQFVSSLPQLRLSLVAWPSTLTITPLIHILVLWALLVLFMKLNYLWLMS